MGMVVRPARAAARIPVSSQADLDRPGRGRLAERAGRAKSTELFGTGSPSMGPAGHMHEGHPMAQMMHVAFLDEAAAGRSSSARSASCRSAAPTSSASASRSSTSAVASRAPSPSSRRDRASVAHRDLSGSSVVAAAHLGRRPAIAWWTRTPLPCHAWPAPSRGEPLSLPPFPRAGWIGPGRTVRIGP
jgi:hypothetical protein